MLSRIRIPEISQKVQIAVFLISVATLTYWVPNSMADASIYFNGGSDLFHGENPYDGSSPFFSAPTGAKFLYVIGEVLLITKLPIIWNIVNILGISAFCYVIFKIAGNKENVLLFISVLLLSAPVREMVVNNQVTGFVLGITAVSIYLAKTLESSSAKVLCFVPIYIVFELKPNLVIGFLIYYLWENRNNVPARRWIQIGILLAANAVFFNDEYIKWFKYITSQGIENFTGFESLGMSTLLFESNTMDYRDARFLGIALFIAIFLTYLAFCLRRNEILHLSFIPLLALCFPYLHFLDLVIALPFIFPRILGQKNVRMYTTIFIVVIFLPRPSDSDVKNLAIVLLIILIATIQFLTNKERSEMAISIISGLVILISNYSLPLDKLSDHQIQNFTVLRTWLVMLVLIITIGLQSTKLKPRRGALI